MPAATPLRTAAPGAHWSATLNIMATIGIAAVLLVAYAGQFLTGELPCPLCMLQRVAFALSLFGFALNVRFGARPLHYALILLAAGFGMVASGRQILLHIAPNSGAYGSPLLGLHYYTWAFIVFAAMIPGTALLLALQPTTPPALIRTRAATFAITLAIAVTAANALTTFAQCGPTECADDPVTWWIAHRG